MEGFGEFGVMTHPVAVAADVDDVAVMDEAIDECSGHDLSSPRISPHSSKPLLDVRTVEATS